MKVKNLQRGTAEAEKNGRRTAPAVVEVGSMRAKLNAGYCIAAMQAGELVSVSRCTLVLDRPLGGLHKANRTRRRSSSSTINCLQYRVDPAAEFALVGPA